VHLVFSRQQEPVMSLAEELTQPISWKSADGEIVAFLEDLQGNILKGHGRHHTANVFCKFPAGKAAAVKSFLKGLVASDLVRSARSQLQDSDDIKNGTATPVQKNRAFCNIMISKAGYDFLGIAIAKQPNDAAFKAGMRGRQALLSDPARTGLQTEYQTDFHALILIATATESALQTERTKFNNLLSAAGIFTGGTYFTEIGKALYNRAKEGIEHFGYVDGRSQPLMLLEDIAHEVVSKGGIENWSPAFGPAQAVTRDPGSAADTSFGSYFVFRKLEERVSAFKESEEALGGKLGMGELAGALVVGRYEDGTPVALSPVAAALPYAEPPKDNIPIANNFNFEQQPPNAISAARGERCPFHSHVRKTNPRTDDTRFATMARRGITYGERVDAHVDPDGRTILDTPGEPVFPTGGVGLLFASFQASITSQFEVIQAQWANDKTFPKTQSPCGIDPVIGQGASVKQKWPKSWGGPQTESHDFYKVATDPADKGPFVIMKGGDYFFAPCLTFLKAL
jgi:Dyp-type peroxidase family